MSTPEKRSSEMCQSWDTACTHIDTLKIVFYIEQVREALQGLLFLLGPAHPKASKMSAIQNMTSKLKKKQKANI